MISGSICKCIRECSGADGSAFCRRGNAVRRSDLLSLTSPPSVSNAGFSLANAKRLNFMFAVCNKIANAKRE